MLKNKYVILTACLFVALIIGCAVIQGKSTRTYQLEYNAAVQASTDALEDLEIHILDEKSDRLKTDILARRADGNPGRRQQRLRGGPHPG
jgi:hypothetical protein